MGCKSLNLRRMRKLDMKYLPLLSLLHHFRNSRNINLLRHLLNISLNNLIIIMFHLRFTYPNHRNRNGCRLLYDPKVFTTTILLGRFST